MSYAINLSRYIQEFSFQKFFYSINFLILVLFFVLTPWYNHFFAVPIILFFLLYFISFFDRSMKAPLDKMEWIVVLCVFSVFLSQAITKFFIDKYTDIAYYEQSFRFLLAVFAFLYYRKYPMSVNVIAFLCVLASFSLTVHAIVYIEKERLISVLPSIKHGTYSAVIAVVCFYFFLEKMAFGSFKSKINALIFLLAFSGSVFVAIKSGSKMPVLSILISLPFLIVLFYKNSLSKINIKNILLILMILLVAGAGSCSLVKESTLLKRFDIAVNSFQEYEFGKKSIRSTSLRMDMWSIANLHKFDAIFLGNGQSGIQSLFQKYVNENVVNKRLGKYQHMHSDYIDIYIRNGILGILPILILYFTLIVFGVCNKSIPIVAFAVVNILCGLTDITFSHMISITIFLTFLIVFYPHKVVLNSQNN